MITLRQERAEDVAAVHALNASAFGQEAEAWIVDAIRAACPDAVSLVAVEEGRIVGHIFFSPVSVSSLQRSFWGMGLGPMAVHPERQRQGIGSRLVQAGFDMMRELGCPFVVVLGHPEYYPRFGFVPASRYDLTCQWQGVPDEVFMVRILDTSKLAGVTGTVSYREEFDQAT